MRKISDSQNFLHNKKLVRELISKSNISGDDFVIEVGPGKGIITESLENTCKNVLAIEYDDSLYLQLVEKFKDKTNVKLLNLDIMQFDLPSESYKFFSNIPFNLTSDILGKFLLSENPPNDMYVVMQHEAALKYCGDPYCNDCYKSLLIKPVFESKIVHRFLNTDFSPVPNIEIVLVHFHKREYNEIKKAQTLDYWDFLSYLYMLPVGGFKEKTKKFFSYEQQKRLKKSLKISEDSNISEWTFFQWMGLFNCYRDMVSSDKKLIVHGSYQKMMIKQSKLDKIHRNRKSGKNNGIG